MEELILLLSEDGEVVVVVIRELGERLEVVLEVETFVGKVTRQVPENIRIEHGVEVAPIVIDVFIVGIEVLTMSLKVVQMIRKWSFDGCTSKLRVRVVEVLIMHLLEVDMKLISGP